MSLPEAFASEDTYFREAMECLHSYSWIYREANTSCIKSLNYMPSDFKAYFLNLSNDKLNAFPFFDGNFENCPEAVISFRQKVSRLIPKQETTSAISSCKSKVLAHKKAPKKQHEIEQLAINIHNHCADKTQLLIDLGAGLGYLSEALLQLKSNYLILGLEADEQRVQTARQRARELLPQDAFKSISYKQLFITSDTNCAASIEHYAAELVESHGLQPATLSTTIIGLHACADLSISAMLLFLSMPQVRCLHIMPCCYHKLTLRHTMAAGSPFVNFPLSAALRQAATAKVATECFNRPFMRLACQQTASRWPCDVDAHADHGSQMYLRAVATALCDDADEMVKLKRCKDKLESPITFEMVQQRYQLYSKLTGEPLNWAHIHEKRFAQISAKYPGNTGCQLAEALCCLQTSMQKVCENLVLFDRLCYLKQRAAEEQLRLEVCYEKLFDEQISPRCQVLIAKKL